MTTVRRTDQDAAGLQIEARALDAGGRQAGDELVEGDVGVGLFLSFPRCAGEVEPADAGEVGAEVAAFEEGAGVLPFVLATLDEVVVGLAAAAGGEDEFLRQDAGRERAPGRRHEHDPVEVAVDRFGRVSMLAARTDERHATYQEATLWGNRRLELRLTEALASCKDGAHSGRRPGPLDVS